MLLTAQNNELPDARKVDVAGVKLDVLDRVLTVHGRYNISCPLNITDGWLNISNFTTRYSGELHFFLSVIFFYLGS